MVAEQRLHGGGEAQKDCHQDKLHVQKYRYNTDPHVAVKTKDQPVHEQRRHAGSQRGNHFGGTVPAKKKEFFGLRLCKAEPIGALPRRRIVPDAIQNGHNVADGGCKSRPLYEIPTLCQSSDGKMPT